MRPRIILSWGFYWSGDFVSRILNSFDGKRWSNFWYPLYHRLMVWAFELQGDGEDGPWGPVECSETEHN